MTNDITYSLQDFSLVKTHVAKITKDLEFPEDKASLGFYFFTLDLLFNLQDDEIDDSITDTAYLMITGKEAGRDRGVDAIYIEDNEIPLVVHIFNFKYTSKFQKTKNNFPSNEIDKMLSLIGDIMQEDKESVRSTGNQVLYSKIEEIWSLYSKNTLHFVIHICSNHYLGFEKREKERFEKAIAKFTNFKIEYHLMSDFVSLLTKKNKQVVNARVRAIDKNLFEKSDGDIRALIVDLDAQDLLRMVIDDEQIRSDVDLDDYAVLKERSILEDAFEDNVRIYLKQRSKINRNIKETALSDDAYHFFYFNNGITITCSRFDYPKQKRGPVIELKNLQVVNGSQTIHALFDAFNKDADKFHDMDVLCRIYETKNEKLSTDIAEYTNSQNPVSSRDIRSNDFVQKKLESELLALGYFYERKKAQYATELKNKRIDAEKAGQSLLAFNNQMPAEAKNKKSIIFAEKYDTVFSDEVTADTVLLAVSLFNEVEKRKLKRKKEILENPQTYNYESYILHATYYILYALSTIAAAKGIAKSLNQYSKIIANYDVAVEAIGAAVGEEQDNLRGYKEDYTHRKFFVSNKPKVYIDEFIKQKKF